MSLTKKPEFVPPSATHNDIGDTAMRDGTTDLTPHDTEHIEIDQHALDNIASNRDLSGTPAPQLAEKDRQTLYEDVALRLFITDLELQCTTEGFESPTFDTVRLSIVGLATGEEGVWLLKRVSEDTWKQASSLIDLPMDVDRGLSIVATSEDSTEFAHMSLMKDELVLDVGTDEARITRPFVSGVGVPAMKLSFAVIRSSEEEIMDEDDSDDELAKTAGELAGRGIDLMEKFERIGNLVDLTKAISVRQRIIELTPNGSADMPGYLNDLGNSLQCRFEHTGELFDIEEAISTQKRAIELTPNDDANMPGYLNDLGNSFQCRFEHTGELFDIEEAISTHQRAIQLIHNGHADMPKCLNNLGNSYQCRFEHTGDLSDISEAISTQQLAVQLTPKGHEDMPGRLNNLGNSYMGRFEYAGDLSDIEEAISTQQQAVQLLPNGHSNMQMCLNNLGRSYMFRFERGGELSDISEAISAQRRAVQLTPSGHADMPMYLNNLGNSFQSRFEHTGNLDDISEAISAQQRAVQLTPNDHADMPGYLTNLGNSFQCRFECTGELPDIEEAVSVQQRAVQLTPDGHADMPKCLNNLATSYIFRFERVGDLSDISEAIANQQRAVQLTPNGHADMPGRLNNLGNSFQCRFEHAGQLPDIEEAISTQQRAIKLIPSGHTDMPTYLNNLGVSFLRRFERTRELSDIAEAISAQQRAIQLTPNGHAFTPGQLNNLGNSYQCRFERTGDLSDISEAISAQQLAVQLTPNGHADMPTYLNSLGVSFLCRFERTGDLPDISQAISTQQLAIQLTPNGHADMPGRLNSLGNSYQCRFERADPGELSDISQVISLQQQAIQLTPDWHARRPLYLNNLGTSFQCRFKRTVDLLDIEEAISAQQQAVQLTPQGHADMPMYLYNLGSSYQDRFKCTGDVTDTYTASSYYQKSATTFGPPLIRLDAARLWAQLSSTHDRPQSLKAYGVAIDLISQVAGMHRTIEQRHTHLTEFSIFTTSAASVAFAQGEINKALEWLEQGRCLVWSQLNQLRTPVNDLREHDEHLAQRFVDISSALELSGSRRGRGIFDIGASLSQKLSLEDEARNHVKLAGEWNQLLDEIRRISGFHDFLRPPRTSDLLKDLPPDGPIILINVQEDRCNALALISVLDAPIHIPLDNFSLKQASVLRDHLHHFLSWNNVRIREADRAIRLVPGHRVKSNIHFVLGALWMHVVWPILDGLKYSYNALLKPHRLWWCPTGPLAFLPLHAAGIYGQKHDERSAPGSCISDFAISSYTPTVNALLQTVKSSIYPRPRSSTKLLIISQPNTPGCSPIKGATEEMDIILKIVGLEDCKSLEAETATVSRVKLEMASHSSIHFACHASQDVESPLKSGFYLHDGRLELAEVMKQKIAHCELAFLSACQTSTGDENLSEEAVHLAAGMLAVGYRGVVATMWSIKDKYGPLVAEGFYQYLMDKGSTPGKLELDVVNPARALHHSIQCIRQQVGDTEQGLLTWVPYVHFGY